MKLAVFGCGRIANRIALSALKVKEIDLVGFASKDIEKAKDMRRPTDVGNMEMVSTIEWE